MKKIVFFIILLFPLTSSAFSTSAGSAILMDTDSGRILYSKNIYAQRSVASISKIMTAMVAIESGKLEDIVTIGDEVNKAYGSGIYIKPGEQLKLKDLLYGLMLRSGNDSALAIANYVGDGVDNFVKLMNDKAKEIGMLNTVFNNPSGLDNDKGNYSTAYDMALLSAYAIKNDTYRQIVGTKKYTLKTNMNTYVWNNKNKLLTLYKYTTGGKTGFTEIAKRTLVSNASKDNLNLTVVTLNDGNDFLDHKNLYEEAFDSYTNYEILKKGPINIAGEEYYKEALLYINESYTYPFADIERKSLKIKYKLNKLRTYNDGDKAGDVIVYINDEEVVSKPIYVKKVEKKDICFFRKITDWIKNIW